MSAALPLEPRRLNVNVGVLGHVDCGKTSLVAALSTKLSTAALDKHPQSKERGITLDLGFSSFTAPLPVHLAGQPYDEVQITLVDCPGHASLIRTIIGGAQIIDMALLVVDVTKGVQAQTAECLVVAEVATDHLLVVLNKVDHLPAEGRAKLLARARKRLTATFAYTKFADCPMAAVAAKPGGGKEVGAPAEGIDSLAALLLSSVPQRLRRPEGPLLFAVDHCFAIRGQGTVLTGTVLQGTLKLGDTIELPALKLQRKVRSLQMFRAPAQSASAGDRAAAAVTQLDANLMERGLAAAPGSVPTFSVAIAAVEKIRFFAGEVQTKARLHVSVGHATVMAEPLFFGLPDGAHPVEGAEGGTPLEQALARIGKLTLQERPAGFDFGRNYLHQEQLHGLGGRPVAAAAAAVPPRSSGGDSVEDRSQAAQHHGPQWALLRFAQPVTAPEVSLRNKIWNHTQGALVIGSKLDADASAATCRLAFYGRLTALLDAADVAQLARLRVHKPKQRVGVIERVAKDGQSAVCRGMFKKETDLSAFAGMQVTTDSGAAGVLEGAFGKSGKFTVRFTDGSGLTPGGRVTMAFKKFIFDVDKRRMTQ